MSEEQSERCETCRYVHDCGNEWLCRRFPIYATKDFNDWCGEWKPIGPDLTTRTDEALSDEPLLAALSRAGL